MRNDNFYIIYGIFAKNCKMESLLYLFINEREAKIIGQL